MKNATICPMLLTLLEEQVHNSLGATPTSTWKDAYCEFNLALVRAVGNYSSPEAIRLLDHLRIELEAQQQMLQLSKQVDPLAKIFCSKALHAVQCERELCIMRLEYPGFGASALTSELLLNEPYHITDLVELIAAFYELKVFKTSCGSSAKLKTIIRVFEQAFNISLTNYDMLRNRALNRKCHLTRFVDRLRDILIELSQR